MVRQIYDLEIILTDSEAEALILESNLIKNYQPYFNVLLKDDKKYNKMTTRTFGRRLNGLMLPKRTAPRTGILQSTPETVRTLASV